MLRIDFIFGKPECDMTSAIQQSFGSGRSAATDQGGEIVFRAEGHELSVCYMVPMGR